MKTEIEELIKRKGAKVSFCTWGRHTATNDYAHIKYVILAGILQYRTSYNEATGRGAKGAKTDEVFSEEEFRETRLGEIANNILQAANRGMVRKSDGAGCPPGCHLYAIFSAHNGTGIPTELLDRIFPGAKLEAWKPFHTLKGKLLEVASLIEAQLAKGRDTISKVDLQSLSKIEDKSYFRRLLRSGDLAGYLQTNGIELVEERRWISFKRTARAAGE